MPLVNIDKMREIIDRNAQLAQEHRDSVPKESLVVDPPPGSDNDDFKKGAKKVSAEKHPSQIAAETHEQAVEQLKQFV